MNLRPKPRMVGILAAIAGLLSTNIHANQRGITVNEKTITNKLLHRKRGRSGLTANVVKRASAKVKNRRKYKEVKRRAH